MGMILQVTARRVARAVLGASVPVLAAALLMSGGSAYAKEEAKAADAVRAELGKPLGEVQALMQKGKYREALAALKDAGEVKNRTPYENYVIERLRASAAARSGDDEIAARSFRAVIASGRLGPKERSQFQEGLIAIEYRAKDYAAVVELASAYFRYGGNDKAIRTLYQQSLYLKGDYTGVAAELTAEIDAGIKANRKPPEVQLQLLASAYLKQSNHAGYISALEHLLDYYPKKEYWTDVIYRIAQLPGMRERLALDLARLRLTVGQSHSVADFLEPAQLSLQAGFPLEALKFLDKGFASGKLGVGPEGERHKRLLELAKRQAAEDSNSLKDSEKLALASADGKLALANGYDLVLNGQNDKGLELMATGISKGGIKYVDDARLLLGYAQYIARQKSKAIQTMRSIKGHDAPAVLARLWVIQLSN